MKYILIVLLLMYGFNSLGQSLSPQCWDATFAGVKPYVRDVYVLSNGVLVPYCLHPTADSVNIMIAAYVAAHPAATIDTTHTYTWAPQIIERDGATTGIYPAVVFQNTTTSTSGSKIKNPPASFWKMHHWDGSVDKVVWGRFSMIGNSGNSVIPKYTLDYSADSITWTNMGLWNGTDYTGAGTITATNGLSANGATGGYSVGAYGGGIYIVQGSTLMMQTGGVNPVVGAITLSSGTITVNTTAVHTGYQIVLSGITPSGTLGWYKQTIVDGVSFTIDSYITVTGTATLNTLDNSTLMYTIIGH